MSIFNLGYHHWRRLGVLVGLVALSGCGLADDPAEPSDRITNIQFSDPAFEQWCLAHIDLDGNGYISYYEAQRVRDLDCSGCGIRTLYELERFTRLERLDCSHNSIESLELTASPALTELRCADNHLVSLNIKRLRGLATLDCSSNPLPRIDLEAHVSLHTLRCRATAVTTLDVAACSRQMLELDARECPSLDRLYRAVGQEIRTLLVDNYDIVQER